MKKAIISSILLSACLAFGSLAATAIVTETTTWKPVPINVDATTHTYTVTGTMPSDTQDYYYTYSGYRCFTMKREAGIDAVIFKASVQGGNDIYCYPE